MFTCYIFLTKINIFTPELRHSVSYIFVIRIAGRRSGKSSKLPESMFPTCFQRAIGYEKLGEVNKAIADYTKCLGIYPTNAPCYFNRSGLHLLQKNQQAALEDLNEAIRLEPANVVYRRNRSLLFRQMGKYTEAIEETMMQKAITLYPQIRNQVASGELVCACATMCVFAGVCVCVRGLWFVYLIWMCLQSIPTDRGSFYCCILLHASTIMGYGTVYNDVRGLIFGLDVEQVRKCRWTRTCCGLTRWRSTPSPTPSRRSASRGT